MRTISAVAITLSPVALVAGIVLTTDRGTLGSPPPPERPSVVVTVDGSDYPLCYVEDCSDQPNQVGVWIDPDTGARWLSVGDRSLPIRP